MRHQNITFSIPEDLKVKLYSHVQKRGMSHFITEAVRKALYEDEMRQEKELDAAYEAASREEDRIETLKEWNAIDNMSDWANGDEDWEWLKKKGMK